MNIKTIVSGIAGLAVAVCFLAVGFAAGRQDQAPALLAAAPEPAIATAEIERIVHAYIVANPEVLVEAQEVLETRQRDEQRIAGQKAIDESRDEIFNAAYDGVVGNPAGKDTVVEFFDYNCSYCKRALPDMQEMVKANPELRFVLKELPILGPDSQKAHTVSMAFRSLMPEKYGEFHRHLLGDPGKAGEAKAIKLAVQLGADEAALRREMANPEIAKAFAITYELANKLSITGTPSYVIGNEVVFGALGREVLEEKVAATGSM